MAKGHSLLVIDDDIELCELLTTYLGKGGFDVTSVNHGEEGFKEATSNPYDLVVLDVMLPGLNGFDVLRKIRTESNIPIIMLTARDEDVDRIVGLELGADDYLPKPFNPRELVARIEAILRRSSATDLMPRESDILEVGTVRIDAGRREVFLDDNPVELTSTEFAILDVLLRAAGKVVTREELSSTALGRNLTRFDRSIDVHVSKLRKKLGGTSDADSRIKTVRGMGYQYVSSRK